MNKNNPFEGKAVKFDTAEQLEHLAELARGYGLKVTDIEYTPQDLYFRYWAVNNAYSNSFRADTLPEITYSDFIASLPIDKDQWIIPPNALPIHTEQPDMVNHPKHYNVKGFEVIDIIDAFGLNFNMGNALKYLLRADRKGNKVQDINKALWYLQREINTK
jgi:hypothetical protein